MKRSWDIPAHLKDDICHLPPNLKRQVREALDFVQKKRESGKLLSEELAGYRSYRIGRYRMIYQIKEERLILKALGPRSDIYERFVLEIGRAKIKERSARYGAKPRKRLASAGSRS